MTAVVNLQRQCVTMQSMWQLAVQAANSLAKFQQWWDFSHFPVTAVLADKSVENQSLFQV